MLNPKFEEIKRRNNRKKLSEKLLSIDSQFSKSIIENIGFDYQKLVYISKKYVVCDEVANGSKINNINNILSSFEIFIKKYIDKCGTSIFKVILPFNNDYFEMSIELIVLSDLYNEIVDAFFKIDSNTSEEILLYKENYQAGLCLFREEHRYYISVW
jgi:hypothetical protein